MTRPNAEVEQLRARCANDDITLALNESACLAIGKLPHEALDEACTRVRGEAAAERAAVVAWLRKHGTADSRKALTHAARLIERGDHRRTP